METDAPVLICGDAWSSNHYHWLMHTLPAIESSIGRNGRDRICPAMLPPRAVRQRSLALPGHASARFILLQAGMQYANPQAEFCQFTTGTADFAVSAFILAIHHRIGAAVREDSAYGERIYITRTGNTHRRMRGEPQLMKKLRRRGFALVDPATMSLEQQVATFRAARVIVAPHGARMTNMVFCRPGAKVYEMLPEKYAKPCFRTLSIRHGLHYWAGAFKSDAGGPAFQRDWTWMWMPLSPGWTKSRHGRAACFLRCDGSRRRAGRPTADAKRVVFSLRCPGATPPFPARTSWRWSVQWYA